MADPLLLSFLESFGIFSAAEITALADDLKVNSYPEGSLLMREGGKADTCWFILKGCVREYRITDGIEKTTAFYTENQAVVSLSGYLHGTPAPANFECTEACVLMEGTAASEKELYERYPKLADLTREMLSADYAETQEAFSRFILSTPEERYLDLLENRPGLLQRVPLHQLSGYIGVTPESLSRIRKRIAQKRF